MGMPLGAAAAVASDPGGSNSSVGGRLRAGGMAVDAALRPGLATGRGLWGACETKLSLLSPLLLPLLSPLLSPLPLLLLLGLLGLLASTGLSDLAWDATTGWDAATGWESDGDAHAPGG